MKLWRASNIWSLSSYGPPGNQSIGDNMCDMSLEEVKWTFKQSKGNKNSGPLVRLVNRYGVISRQRGIYADSLAECKKTWVSASVNCSKAA